MAEQETKDGTLLNASYSHRRHGQDKTRQFCLVRVGGVNKSLACHGVQRRTALQKVT